MRVTTQGEYGLNCMLNLARVYPNRPMSAKEISTREHIPASYISKLLGRLRKAELVTSIRGAHGGYVLARPPVEITVRDVLVALEEEMFHVICSDRVKGTTMCAHQECCGLSAVWIKLYEVIGEVLRGVDLQCLLQDEAAVREQLGVQLPRVHVMRDQLVAAKAAAAIESVEQPVSVAASFEGVTGLDVGVEERGYS